MAERLSGFQARVFGGEGFQPEDLDDPAREACIHLYISVCTCYCSALLRDRRAVRTLLDVPYSTLRAVLYSTYRTLLYVP